MKGSLLRVELSIDLGDKEKNTEVLERLQSEKEAIEKEFGEELSWEPLEHRRSCRIAVYRPGTIDDGEIRLENLMNEAVSLIKRLDRVFRRRIAQIGK